jgi:hypothetical protein
MWETSRFRGKNQGGNGDGGKKAPKMRMKRIQTQILASNGFGMEPTQIPVRLVLNDLGPQSVTVFALNALELGHEVALTIEYPRPLHVRGKVTYCALFDVVSRVHNSNRFPYRMQIEFEFLNDGEMIAVREYVEELQRKDLAA